MNIEQHLNDIIFKYDLDKYYPRFRKRLQAEQLIGKWVKELAQRKSYVLCIGAEPEDILYFSNFVVKERVYFTFIRFSEVQLEVPDWSLYDRIFLISLRGAESIELWCRKYCVKYENIYDYLAYAGIMFEDECYRFNMDDSKEYADILEEGFKGYSRGNRTQDSILLELFVQQRKLRTTENTRLKTMYLEKIFFLCIYMKNFIQAEKCMEQLKQINNNCNYSALISAWNDIQCLLKQIKERLRERKNDHIVLYWLDSLIYGKIENMPYLQKQLDKGISFENAFTVTPNTNPTFTTMFCGMKEVTDKAYQLQEIKAEDSNVILYLKEMGYEFKTISGYMSRLDNSLRTQEYHNLFAPSSEIFWDVLKYLLIDEKKKFLLAHALIEGHSPYLFTNMQEEDLRNPSSRYHSALTELDTQIEFYNEFLNDNVTKIIMSDHGHGFFRERFHVYMSIISKKFIPSKIQDLFSLHDFSKLLCQIIEKNEIDITAFKRDYVEIQALDLYNRRRIEKMFRHKKALTLTAFFGYCGIITKQHFYVRFNTGKEWLVRNDDYMLDPYLCDTPHDICDEGLLPYFRKLTENVRIDIYSDENFKYSRYSYKLYENFKKHKKDKCKILNNLFEGYPSKSIAIRIGGMHTANLHRMLTSENQDKILCIVDYNSKCVCCNLGYPIVSPDELWQTQAKAILLSSYDHLDAIREEAREYQKDIQVLNLYDYLDKQGIICKGNFYEQENLPDEAYDVGFPFTSENV